MLLFLFLTVLFPQKYAAQNGFSWDTWVGCGVGENDRKNYTELIESGQCHRVCQQSTVTYTITGALTSQMSNTVWHVVGGTILSTPNNSQCVVKWGGTSTGAIGFTTTQVPSNTIVTIPDICVNLTINPQAYFTIAPFDPLVRPPNTYNACAGQELFFENLSTTNGGTAITSYYWDFGDGTTSSAETVSHTYIFEGTYTMSLKVDNQCSCSSILSYTIYVGRRGVQIDCPSIVCEGQKARYTLPTGFAENCFQFNWTVIGGTILSPQPYGKFIDVLWSEQPPTQGFGYVTFDPVNCNVSCYKASTLKIPIIKQKATIVGEVNLCGPTQTKYKLPQWPTTDFVWEVENTNGATATLTYTDQRNEILLNTGTTAGTAILKCRYTNTLLNCGGNASPLSIIIKQPAAISGPSLTCVGSTENYSENNGLSLTWSLKKLPNGVPTNYVGVNFTTTFTSAGDYSLIATGPTICNPISKIITVTQNAVPLAADFTSPLTICSGTPTTYTFNNTVPNTRIRWEVTGGVITGSNYGNSVQITFGLPPATYSIKLWRENNGSPACSSAPLVLTPIIPVPLIDIKGATLATAPNQTPCGSSFETYRVEANDMDFYEWEISPPFAGNISYPNANQRWIIQVLWNQYTNQQATLKLKTKKCLISHEKTIGITISSPTVTITPVAPIICRGQSQLFSLSSNLTTFSGTILWDFGNGVTLTTTTPFVNYAYTNLTTAQASYLVKATITNPNGCPSVVTTTPVTVTVKVAPVGIVTPANNIATSSPDVLSIPLAARTLTVTLSAGYVGVNDIKWYRVTNNITTLVQQGLVATYVVTAFGTYYAELTSNTTNCSSKTNSVTFSQIIPDTTPACPASFNPILTLTNNCGTVTATVTGVGNPVSVQWANSLVQPTGVTTNTNATFIFPGAGSYDITYVATYNNNGTVCKVVRNANIIVPYIADLKYAITCGAGANYNVKLYDNSNFYNTTLYNNIVYKIRRTTVATFTNYTPAQVASGVALAAGFSYIAIIEITKTTAPAYLMCSKEVTFVLPAKPTIAFAFANSTATSITTCPDERINFTRTPTAINPNWKYEWTFATGNPPVTNTQPNAYVTYTSPNTINQVTLKITDQYGCTFTTPAKQITVRNATQLSVTTDPQNITQCIGTTATLSFTPSIGIPAPVSYLWMQGNSPVVGGTTNPFTVTTAGSYWLQTANSTGCFRRVDGFSVSVAFVNIPQPDILTQPLVCNNNGVPLQNTSAGNPSYEYIWRRDGVVISNAVSLTDYPPTGTYIYTLEVRALQSNGTYCTKTSAPRTVVVIDNPEITNISFENILNPLTGTCNPFRIKLKATANAIGTFTWSNGASGAEIPETAGGAYQVLFTTASGCTATAQIYVPKDLTSYMWIVPQGCYTFCDKLPTQQLIGPAIQEFDSWAWLRNNTAAPAGILAVTPKNLNASNGIGEHQLQLNNAVCSYISDPFSITYENCDRNINCNWFSVAVTSVTPMSSPYIYYNLSLAVTNTTSATIIATITSQNSIGFFSPATITVPPGGGTYTVTLFPNSLLSGSIDILVTTTDLNNNLCQKILSANLSGDIEPSRKGYGIKTANNSLLVFPNPASDTVTIQYEFSSIKELLIEVYDTTARLIDKQVPTSNKGNWQWDVNRLAAGLYVVVLKHNGEVVAQENLIKK